ncbi:pyridoxamine 5'-phosphate oxidase family protein [Streptomyces sp. G-G2]|uniref:helix-turn-helix domain-containing protein n=1 Tax=Streptomyces sp. G-G2 TaxID=3046201 RepID=UPI0024B8C159|nr:pyridoxamine 5'-phosphate oxidase family protein [Streptomyces sp. G-G2]MDJ0382342.1 pyridoxamine 5'-phosphate oxidase family protein [Streptomyces sp. G-G2]
MTSTPARSVPTGGPAGRSDLGRRAAARRRDLSLSREQVAERSGLAASYVAYLEDHAVAPGIGSLLRLADALGTTVDELTGTTTESPPGRAAGSREGELVVLSDAECRRLLSTHGIGRMAIVTANGPTVSPVNYVMADGRVAFRTSGDGTLAAAAGTDAAFEVDQIDDAMSQGWSVLVMGELSRVSEDSAVRRLDATAPSLPWAGGERTHWMTVAPSLISGRRVVRGPTRGAAG